MKAFFVSTILLIVISGCATVKMPEPQHFIQSDEVQLNSQGKVTVYFYRISKFIGGAVTYHIREGNDIIGALKSGAYFKHVAEPGERFFWAENEKISSVAVICEPDHEYYIEGDVSMGAWMGNPELTLVPKEIARTRMQGLQHYTFDFSRKAPSQ